jgi:glycosyltransferase involved in cell wall biosynthesis
LTTAPSHVAASEGPAPESRSKPLRGAVASGAVSPKRAVLLVAFHYPPCGVSSGLQRAFCFSRDLLEYNWSPLVLTAHPRAYPATKTDQLSQIPAAVRVRRAFALDSTKHLAIRGRYFGWSALPDAWVTWLLGAIPAGLEMIRRYRPRVIWSTYPLATAHLIGMALHRSTGIPWIADFRDPMTEIDSVTQQRFPENATLWRVRRWIERKTLELCTRAVFVTPGALQMYQARYPQFADRMTLVGNGYDEVNFQAAEGRVELFSEKRGKIVLVHSGVLYPGPDRDPSAFFAALAELRRSGQIPSNLEIRLRATGYDSHYQKLIARFGLQDVVRLEPAISYQDALAEMLAADGLLVFQGSTSNPAVPAKLYEYIRARRPIFALVDKAGDTAAVLRQAGAGVQVPLDDSAEISKGLLDFLAQLQGGTAPLPRPDAIEQHSRRLKARELAGLMDEVAGKSAPPEAMKTGERREA